MQLIVRSLVCLLIVLGASAAFAWLWDHNDAPQLPGTPAQQGSR